MQKLTQTSLIILILGLVSFSSISTVYAQHVPLPSCADLIAAGETPLSWPHCTIYVLGQLIITVIRAALIFGALLLLINLFKSAMDYITSGDDTKKLEIARANIVWSIIGMFGIASVFILFDYILELIPGLDTLINYGNFN